MIISNLLLITVVIIFLALFILAEFIAVNNYRGNKEFETIEQLIKKLNEDDAQQKNKLQNSQFKEEWSWILRHLSGENRRVEFIPKKENNQFILSSYPSILNRSIPRSPVYYAPTFLTALGILGTFWGIFSGLQDIGIDAINDTQNLLDASKTLLSGMRTAFSTSLVGLGSASLMMIGLWWGGKLRRDRRNNLRKKLNNIAYLESPQQLLSRLDTSSITDVADSLQEATNSLSSLSNLTPDNIALAIQKVISQEKVAIVEELKVQNNNLQNLTPEAIAQAMTPLLNPINEEIIKLRENQEQQQSTIQQLVKQMKNELIEPVVERLDQSAKLTEEASNAVRELKEELGGIAQSLAGAVETIQEFQKDTLIKLQDFAQNLQSILSQFRNDTEGVLNRVAEEINQAVAKSIEGMEAQREAFEISANQASNTFRGIREDLTEALNTQAQQQKEMLEGVKTSTERILQEANEVFKNQSETLTTVGEEASTLMNQAKENLLGTLNNIDEMLQKTRETVQIELERFRLEYQNALTEFFERQNNLLNETLGKQRDGLAEVVNDLQASFKEEITVRKQINEEVNSSLNNIQETVRIVSNLVNATGMNSSERFAQLEELARTIGDEATKVESAYQKMENQFNRSLQQSNQKLEQILNQIIAEFDQLSAQTNKQINDYLALAGDSYGKSFQQADSAMANVCSQLNETSIGLVEVSKYLVASANELKDKNHN